MLHPLLLSSDNICFICKALLHRHSGIVNHVPEKRAAPQTNKFMTSSDGLGLEQTRGVLKANDRCEAAVHPSSQLGGVF